LHHDRVTINLQGSCVLVVICHHVVFIKRL